MSLNNCEVIGYVVAAPGIGIARKMDVMAALQVAYDAGRVGRHGSIHACMVWEHTPQGSGYWHQVHMEFSRAYATNSNAVQPKETKYAAVFE